MPRPKMVYLTAAAHQRLKLLAVRRSRTMGEIVEEMVDRELADVAGPWTGPDGLLLQQQVLSRVWSDPALDVYDRD